jgi:hypothetical protein
MKLTLRCFDSSTRWSVALGRKDPATRAAAAMNGPSASIETSSGLGAAVRRWRARTARLAFGTGGAAFKQRVLTIGSVHGLVLAGLLAMLGDGLVQAAELAPPAIRSVHVENGEIVVVVSVPVGLRKITLQSCQRVGLQAWQPRAVARLDGSGGEVTLRLPATAELELLRVRADVSDPLPAAFYNGATTFEGTRSSSRLAGGPEVVALDAAPPVGGDSRAAASRTVVESDIWTRAGSTLYFFNQTRGLQIIDLSQPDAPVLRGSLSIPGAGEQMYLVDNAHVALLLRASCGWGWGGGDPNGSGSEVVVANVAGATPTVVARLRVPGWIGESRLVGTALYVASSAYREVTLPPPPGDTKPTVQWEWGTLVSAFDLSNPAQPIVRTSAWVPGYTAALAATDRFLFVATSESRSGIANGQPWWYAVSTVHIVDISAPDGTLRRRSKLETFGSVKSKFNLHLEGDVLCAVTERWQSTVSTRVETFSLTDPDAPVKLGDLRIIDNETLFATRYDGPRLYAVTFQRIDPLWVIDLSNPAQPRKLGELEIPGWSSYIEPLGDRLISVGIDNTAGWRVAVSLFDVADPAKPALLSRVFLGENHSWSEANYDEKAFRTLPEAGLILVPFASWEANRSTQGVQLVDFNRQTLTKRGVIAHAMQPRRATLYDNRILSISSRELLSVDAADRDHPVVRGELELGSPVDRVFAHGDFLVQIETQSERPVLRVVSQTEPHRVVRRVEAPVSLPVIGASLQGDSLFLLQGRPQQIYSPAPPAGDTKPDTLITNDAQLALVVYDVGALPELVVRAQTKIEPEQQHGWYDLEPLWPLPGLLVWAERQSWWGPWMWDRGPGLVMGDAIWPGGRWGPWWGGGSRQLVAFDVSSASQPRFVSALNIAGTNTWSFARRTFAADGLLLTSHQESTPIITGTNVWFQTVTEVELRTNIVTEPFPATNIVQVRREVIVTNAFPIVEWSHKHYLDVVDFALADRPAVRAPVNIPGELHGVSPDGALLYTVVYRAASAAQPEWREWLDVSAYDGVRAFLIDSAALPAAWPHPVLVDQRLVFVGNPGDASTTQHAVEVWTLSESGRLTRTPEFLLDQPAAELAALGGLLVMQTQSDVRLFDLRPASLFRPLGKEPVTGCFGVQLDRAHGSTDLGLWVPMGDHGVWHVPVSVGNAAP